jgi:class 3 adenylate cyclase
MQQNRQLAAIFFADIVGSTSMMQKHEQVEKGYSQSNREEFLRRYCEINGI